MSFPKYKYLLTYRYAEILCDLGVVFSRRFYLSSLGNLSDLSVPVRRTVEQFTQALRSGKQNIIEGVSEVASLKSQIKLLGIALASFEEATADLEDFLRQRGLKLWPKTDPRIADFQKIGYRFSNLSNLSDLESPCKARRCLLVSTWFQVLFHSPLRGTFHLSLTVLVHYRWVLVFSLGL